MWICAQCGEKIEDQLDSCWKCAAQPKTSAPSPKSAKRWRQALFFGVLFEGGLILLLALLPNNSWLCVKVFNFLILSHYPLYALLGIFSIFLMVPVWAFLYYWGWKVATRVAAALRITPRQRLRLGCCFGFLCATGLAIVFMDALHNTPTPFKVLPEVKSAVEGNTAFALDLYQKLKERPGNLFFSPYSISTALAVAYAGARGQTESEITRTLHFTLPQTNLHAAFGDLITRMEQIQRWRRITLGTANSLWCQRDHPFTDAFLNVARARYKAEARLVDFKQAAPAVGNEINTWVEKKTKGRIKDMTAPGRLADDTRLVLCNAIYFKGNWASQFKPGNTKPATFSITTNQTVSVPMMYQSSEFKMTQSNDLTIQLAELPYYGNDLSMIILLPEAADGLPELERQLSADNLHAWLARLDQATAHKTSVHLPRFTTSQGFELADELKSLGMPTAFDIKAADFSGVDGINYLYLSDALHKAFIEVNEAGTEAAATTLLQGKSKSSSDRFNANHPFMFLIRENGSGSILFLGRVVDPTK